jgi:hypothetical protein
MTYYLLSGSFERKFTQMYLSFLVCLSMLRGMKSREIIFVKFNILDVFLNLSTNNFE